MRMRRLHHPATGVGKVNVTPLIDVVMVLIVFYLIVGKLASERQVPVDLPSTTVGVVESPAQRMVIQVAGGAVGPMVYVEGVRVQESSIEELVRGRLAAAPQLVVQVRADQSLPYSAVGPVVEACRRAGLASLRLVTERAGGG